MSVKQMVVNIVNIFPVMVGGESNFSEKDVFLHIFSQQTEINNYIYFVMKWIFTKILYIYLMCSNLVIMNILRYRVENLFRGLDTKE